MYKNIFLAMVVLSLLIVLDNNGISDPFVDKVYTKETRNLIRDGFVIGAAGAGANAGVEKLAPNNNISVAIGSNAGRKAAAAGLALSEGHALYKNDRGWNSLEKTAIKTIATIVGVYSVEYAVMMLEMLFAKNGGQNS